MAFKWQRLTNLNFLHRNINAYGIQNLNRLLLIIMYIDSSGHCWERAVKFSIISFTNYEALTTLREFIILICRLRHRTTVYLFHNTWRSTNATTLSFWLPFVQIVKLKHIYIYNSKKVTWCWYWSPIFDLFGATFLLNDSVEI